MKFVLHSEANTYVIKDTINEYQSTLDNNDRIFNLLFYSIIILEHSNENKSVPTFFSLRR